MFLSCSLIMLAKYKPNCLVWRLKRLNNQCLCIKDSQDKIFAGVHVLDIGRNIFFLSIFSLKLENVAMVAHQAIHGSVHSEEGDTLIVMSLQSHVSNGPYMTTYLNILEDTFARDSKS